MESDKVFEIGYSLFLSSSSQDCWSKFDVAFKINLFNDLAWKWKSDIYSAAVPNESKVYLGTYMLDFEINVYIERIYWNAWCGMVYWRCCRVGT